MTILHCTPFSSGTRAHATHLSSQVQAAHTAPLFAGTLTRTSSHPHTLAPVCGWARACLRGSSTRRLKAGCFLSPAVSCCHRGWLRCCPAFRQRAELRRSNGDPPTCETHTSKRAAPRRVTKPGAGRVPSGRTPEPGTGAVAMWPLGPPRGPWPLARVRAQLFKSTQRRLEAKLFDSRLSL